MLRPTNFAIANVFCQLCTESTINFRVHDTLFPKTVNSLKIHLRQIKSL